MFLLLSILFQIITLMFLVVGNAEADLTSSHCASIFTEKHFQGFRLNITSESRWHFKGHLNFTPNSVKILDPDCALTMFDGKGNIQTIKETTAHMNWPSHRPVHLSCCQCGQCERMGNREDIGCARIYQYEKCSACIGTYLQIRENEELTDFRVIHDRLASVALKNGCQLQVMYEVTRPRSWKVLINVDLKNGDNFMESQGLFNENASVHVKKAFCSCNKNREADNPEKVPHIAVEDIVVTGTDKRKIQETQDSEDDFSLSKEVYDREQVGSEQEPNSVEDRWLLY